MAKGLKEGPQIKNRMLSDKAITPGENEVEEALLLWVAVRKAERCRRKEWGKRLGSVLKGIVCVVSTT